MLVRRLMAGMVMTLATHELAAAQQSVQTQLDRLVGPAARVGEFSGAILIRHHDRTVASGAYGLAVREFGVRNTLETKFLMGSIGKQFTAAAILSLAEAGRLRLDDHLSRWLPSFPGADRITIRHLITHRSGISRDLPGGIDALKVARTTAQMVALIATDSLRFEPGAREAYSNNGYRILAHLVETISGEPFASYLTKAILGPAGLARTGQLETNTTIPGLAAGYAPGFGPDGFGPASFADISNGVGPGSLYTTVNDLAIWGERVLRDGRVLPAVARGLTADSGLGIVVARHQGRRVFWHDGVYQGYTALLGVFPDDSATVVYLGNTETLLSQIPLQRALFDLALGLATEPLVAPPIGRVRLDVATAWYLGTYRFFPGLEVTITERDGALLLDGLPLEHQGGGQFYYRLKGSNVTFDEGPGQSPGMSWTDPSGTYRAKRLR